MTTYKVSFPAPAPLMSMNDRLFWRAQRSRAKQWRSAAGWFALNAKLGELPPCTVSITLPVKDRRKRDPHNYFVTVKHIVDGLVDAGVWPDDCPEYVTTTEPVLEPGGVLVVVRMVER